MANEIYFCPSCANVLTWDEGGVLSGVGWDCWYCDPTGGGCGDIINPSGKYPAPTT